ncbi:hypothetical protein Lalb_Chr18g0051171 [Lupinus albus]|uniref:Uncharacterized protein n=1 Tax=Lupinus albus TaxID=3870 RepID=A0A6A4P3K3_LUPAL|nr:hypothetical protein Lalb_Chr18g0051171 [Lupinus albus]
MGPLRIYVLSNIARFMGKLLFFEREKSISFYIISFFALSTTIVHEEESQSLAKDDYKT